ncbi:hypothetical protein [Iodobacter sp.]|uniref:hypothetical protein n=1 Tax=Iodobacter sp. TaxID=1915058 RepID=UPI0025D43633|nr:hypothetical protein [Iodobacter sp.]
MGKLKSIPVDIKKDPESRTVCYSYKAESTPTKDGEPVILMCGCTCPIPKDNYPFKPPVFEYLQSIQKWIKHYSSFYNVPPVAVAGSIADEYNTRFMEDYSALKNTIDFGQDNTTPNPAVNDEKWSQKIEDGYQKLKQKDPNNESRGWDDRLLNISAGDYGKANISLRTAIDLFEEHRKTFAVNRQNMSRGDLLKYLVTDEGTAQFTALAILDAQNSMFGVLSSLPPRKQESVLVTYFKQGPKYFRRYQEVVKNNATNKINPGEGCRTCYQRVQIGQAIGVKVPYLEPQ